MEKFKGILWDALFTLLVLAAAFFLNLLLDYWFDTPTLVPMIFVLGIFLISLKTQHFFWGIAASFVSVLLVNYAFTYPYFGIDLVSPECIVSALGMLVVAILTGMLSGASANITVIGILHQKKRQSVKWTAVLFVCNQYEKDIL